MMWMYCKNMIITLLWNCINKMTITCTITWITQTNSTKAQKLASSDIYVKHHVPHKYYVQLVALLVHSIFSGRDERGLGKMYIICWTYHDSSEIIVFSNANVRNTYALAGTTFLLCSASFWARLWWIVFHGTPVLAVF